jgi:hypothetical protein
MNYRWMCRVWMVENHYLDMVMCQLNLYQHVPSSVLIPYEHILTYRTNKHTFGGGEGQNMDWEKYYWRTQDEPDLPVTETRPYNFAEHFCVYGLVL